jgi:hypothetical protein
LLCSCASGSFSVRSDVCRAVKRDSVDDVETVSEPSFNEHEKEVPVEKPRYEELRIDRRDRPSRSREKIEIFRLRRR